MSLTVLSSDTLLNPAPANPGPPTVTATSSASSDPPVASTSEEPSDAASGIKAARIDPDWPSPLTDEVRTGLFHRGPSQTENTLTFTKQKDGRRCQHDYFNRHLVNGEKIRSWLMYSKKDDSLHCFS